MSSMSLTLVLILLLGHAYYTNSAQDKHFEVTPKTTFEEFQSVLKDDRRTANIERYILELVFERVSYKQHSTEV